MKLRGGEWSKGDIFALVGVVAAVLAIPGMPKLLHWDSDSGVKPANPPNATPSPAPRRTAKTADVASGQVNFGCDQTLSVETPVVPFGKNPQNVLSKPGWVNTDNVKAQNQTVENVKDANLRVIGIKAVGTITGRDSQYVSLVKNCPGGGHGELTLHVTWTEDE
jgi:hypothetical protein